MEIQIKPFPSRELHKIVWVKVGVFFLFAITFPLAMIRVSQMEKFRGFHVKSLTMDLKKLSGESVNLERSILGNSGLASASSSPEKTTPVMPVPAGNPEAQAVNSTPQTAEITNLVELEVLTRKLYDQLDRGWQTSPTFENNLVYRVRVRPDGAVAGYEPLNQAAKDYLQETPLSAWQPSRVNADTPTIAQFTVVFSPSGVLEVSH